MKSFGCFATALFLAVPAAATTINFDDSNVVPLQLSNQYASSGVIFDQIERSASFVFNVVPASSPNYATPFWSSSNPGTFDFVDPTDAAIEAFTDSVTITMIGLSTPAGHPGNFSGATIDALDVFGNVIPGQTQTIAGTSTQTSDLSLTFTGQIHALRFTQTPGTSGVLPFDNVTFGSLASIPEPSTVLLVGIAAIAVARRGRTRPRRRS
jgi:hypothetical protein